MLGGIDQTSKIIVQYLCRSDKLALSVTILTPLAHLPNFHLNYLLQVCFPFLFVNAERQYSQPILFLFYFSKLAGGYTEIYRP